MSFNYCNLPPWVIASRHFNENPQPLEIQGVRLANKFLFERLDATPSPSERAEVFNDYMSVKFQLHQWQSQETTGARKALKNSYLRFLRGWMMDSNSVEGAVLKGWVESRLGLPPTFHKAPIGDLHGDEYLRYAMDRTKGSARTSAINSQLDLLYEYCQYELALRYPDNAITLYRGTYDRDEYELLEKVSKREELVRLNNLSSFTMLEERAWEFGFIVWEVRVPLCKIFFYSDLLPNSILKGEDECLVVGGEYLVKRIMCST